MKLMFSTLCAAVLSLSPLAVGSASAASMTPIAAVASTAGSSAKTSVLDDLVQVQQRRYQQDRRGSNRNWNNQRPRYDSRHRRPPVHRPAPRQQSRGPDLGSAIVGAIVGGVIVNQLNQPQQQYHQPRSQAGFLSNNHINWCHNRWRSYRVVDNSYQPYNGPRRVCVSPYGPT